MEENNVKFDKWEVFKKWVNDYEEARLSTMENIPEGFAICIRVPDLKDKIANIELDEDKVLNPEKYTEPVLRDDVIEQILEEKRTKEEIIKEQEKINSEDVAKKTEDDGDGKE